MNVSIARNMYTKRLIWLHFLCTLGQNFKFYYNKNEKETAHCSFWRVSTFCYLNCNYSANWECIEKA